jgi:hypothetical protein
LEYFHLTELGQHNPFVELAKGFRATKKIEGYKSFEEVKRAVEGSAFRVR